MAHHLFFFFIVIKFNAPLNQNHHPRKKKGITIDINLNFEEKKIINKREKRNCQKKREKRKKSYTITENLKPLRLTLNYHNKQMKARRVGQKLCFYFLNTTWLIN